MLAQQYDISIKKGARWVLNVLIEDESGNIPDLRNHVIKAQVRNSPDSASANLLLTMAVVDTGLSAGSFQLFLAASSTQGLPFEYPPRPFKVAYWDLLIAPTGAASAAQDDCYLFGIAKIVPQVTFR